MTAAAAFKAKKYSPDDDILRLSDSLKVILLSHFQVVSIESGTNYWLQHFKKIFNISSSPWLVILAYGLEAVSVDCCYACVGKL